MKKNSQWGFIVILSLILSVSFLRVPIQAEALEMPTGDGQIQGISGRELEVNIGKNSGIAVGSKLMVFRYKQIKRGDYVLKVEKLKVGELEIIEVGETSSKAKMARSYRTVLEGDLVFFSEPEPKAEVKSAPVVESKPAPVQKPSGIIEVERTPEPVPAKVAEPAPVVEPKEVEVAEVVEEKVQPSVQESALGNIVISTNPPKAELFLNGELLGASPKTVLDKEPGTYNVKAVKKNYYTCVGQVKVKGGQNSTLGIDLKRLEGEISINSSPKEAALMIDGKSYGKTGRKVYLIPGKHTIVLQKNGYKQLRDVVVLSPNTPVVLNLVLEKVDASEIDNMIYIPKGDVIIGDENNKKTVTIDGFYIDKYEVTNAEFKEFVDATGNMSPAFWHDDDLNKPNLPVVGVSWDDAAAYAKWAGKRLPTEAEWEKAARGFDGRTYPWGDNFENNRANKYGTADGYQFTAPAKSFKNGASPYGVINMAGNVWEWCDDWYAQDYYANLSANNPKGPASGEMKSIRGGAWDSSAENLHIYNRYAEPKNTWHNNIGFRCAK